MTNRIAAIIVNYGTADLAIQAAESLLERDHGGRRVDVHLVDNASPGGDADILRAAYAERGWEGRLTLWLEPENHGFGRGNNVVLKALAAVETPPDYVYLLNPDARLENEAVDLLAAALDGAPKAGAVGGRVLRPDLSHGTGAFRFPGLASEMSRLVALGALDRVLARWRVALPEDHPAGPVDWVSGASVMFRFQAVTKIDFFDPVFFLYYEEVDLMRRLKAAGWHILYLPQARVVHEEGAATGQFAGSQGRKRDPAYLYDSWRYYFSGAYGRFGALAIALMSWPAAALNVIHRRARGKTPGIPLSYFRDHWQHVLRPLLFGQRP